MDTLLILSCPVASFSRKVAMTNLWYTSSRVMFNQVQSYIIHALTHLLPHLRLRIVLALARARAPSDTSTARNVTLLPDFIASDWGAMQS